MRFAFMFLILFISQLIFGQENLRIEPPNWWTGMKNDKLQLMIHGENVGQFKHCRVNTQFVDVLAVHQLESYNYLFIDIELKEDLLPGKYMFTLSNGKSDSIQLTYEFSGRAEGSAERKGFDASDVVYLIMPDRFANGDPGNDTVAGLKEKRNRSIAHGRHGGDIQGIIDHLDYLENLGITAIWPTPLLLDDESTYSYHTYAISDYYMIDPRYGTNADYRRLAEACHKRGIKLIKDMVPNHCGGSHWWMQDLPQKDWVHQFDEFTRSSHRKQTLNDPYGTKADKQLFEEGWFDITMPDLNQSNKFLSTYLTQNAIWWIEYASLDGLRVDTYLYNDKYPIAQWSKAIRDEYPSINIVGESWQNLPSEIAYWQSGVSNYDGYDSYLPSAMDFCLNSELAKAFNEDEQGWDKGMVRLYNSLTKDYLYPDPNNLMIFCDNHDITRYAGQVGNDVAKYKLAFSFLLTTRGIPQIYYGSEIMMDGNKSEGDGDIRKDFPGGWPEDTRNAFNPSGRSYHEQEVYKHLRKLLNWRKRTAVIHKGKLLHYVPEDNIYVYFRILNDERVMVVLNNNAADIELDTYRFRGEMPAGTIWESVLTGEQYSDPPVLNVKAKSALILQNMKHEK